MIAVDVSWAVAINLSALLALPVLTEFAGLRQKSKNNFPNLALYK